MGVTMDINNFQRVGSLSNAHAGSQFEELARTFFATQGLALRRGFEAAVGAGELKKKRKFDLGSDSPPVLVECKSHAWTQGGNVPSAKMTVWNESMYYFYLAPEKFRKIFFVLKHDRKDQSLAAYYLKNYAHLVPPGVEFWEYASDRASGMRLR
jgi:hypothetical protein